MTIEETEKEVGAIIESLQNQIAAGMGNRELEDCLIDARELKADIAFGKDIVQDARFFDGRLWKLKEALSRLPR